MVVFACVWGVDPGRDPQHDLLDPSLGPGQVVQQPQLVQIVYDDPAHAAVQRHPELVRGLVVAVDVDVLGREVRGLGHRQLATRDHVHP